MAEPWLHGPNLCFCVKGNNPNKMKQPYLLISQSLVQFFGLGLKFNKVVVKLLSQQYVHSIFLRELFRFRNAELF